MSRALCVGALTTALLAAALPSGAGPGVVPGADWEVRTPESQGVDPEGLAAALAHLRGFCGEDGVGEVVVVRNGYLIHRGEAADTVHDIWSCTKSFTSTALGLLLEDGAASLGTRAAAHEPLLEEHYPTVTLRHFTTMTSGYSALGRSRWDEDSEDWSATPFVPAPPLFAPGTRFAYWDEAMIMFGRVLTRIAGRDLQALLKERVTDPIGLGTWEWWSEEGLDGVPLRFAATGIKMSALQLARYGLVFLNEGRWGETQVLPADWIRQATKPQVPSDVPVADTDRAETRGSGVYGFNWWVNGTTPEGTRHMPHTPPRTFYASGLNNNLLFVVPEWNLVFVRTGVDGNPPEGKPVVYDSFFAELAKAVKK
jgi:CubicO group peptidase (beta-lactamase class C family)